MYFKYVMFSNSDAPGPGMELQDGTIDLYRTVGCDWRPKNILYETQQCQKLQNNFQ